MEEERGESTDVKTASWPHVVLMGQMLTFSPVRRLAQSRTVNSVIHSFSPTGAFDFEPEVLQHLQSPVTHLACHAPTLKTLVMWLLSNEPQNNCGCSQRASQRLDLQYPCGCYSCFVVLRDCCTYPGDVDS